MQPAVTQADELKPAVVWEYVDGSHPVPLDKTKASWFAPYLTALVWIPTVLLYDISWLVGTTVALTLLASRWLWATIETGFREGMRRA